MDGCCHTNKSLKHEQSWRQIGTNPRVAGTRYFKGRIRDIRNNGCVHLHTILLILHMKYQKVAT